VQARGELFSQKNQLRMYTFITTLWELKMYTFITLWKFKMYTRNTYIHRLRLHGLPLMIQRGKDQPAHN
jgi:hypothetical protein